MSENVPFLGCKIFSFFGQICSFFQVFKQLDYGLQELNMLAKNFLLFLVINGNEVFMVG